MPRIAARADSFAKWICSLTLFRMTVFALSTGLDTARLAEMYGRSGRLQIGNFLEAGCAKALLSELAASTAWRLAVNRGDQILDYSREAYAALTPEQRARLGKAIALGGRYGFQYCYDTIRLPKDSAAPADGGTPLARLADFL